MLLHQMIPLPSTKTTSQWMYILIIHLPTWDGMTVMWGCEWYQPITLVILPVVAVILFKEVKCHTLCTSLNTTCSPNSCAIIHIFFTSNGSKFWGMENGYLCLCRSSSKLLRVCFNTVFTTIWACLWCSSPHQRCCCPIACVLLQNNSISCWGNIIKKKVHSGACINNLNTCELHSSKERQRL